MESLHKKQIAPSDRFEEVMRLARTAAIRLGNDHVSPDHILLGMIYEGKCLGVALLRHMHVDTGRLARLIQAKIAGGCEMDIFQRVPLSTRTKVVIEGAGHIAVDRGHSRFSTEHFLLALLLDYDIPSAEILASMGVTSMRYREAIEIIRYDDEPGDSPIDAKAAQEAADRIDALRRDAKEKINALRHKPRNQLTDGEIESLLKWSFVVKMGVHEDELIPEAQLRILCEDSLDLVEVSMMLEDEFNLVFDDDETSSLVTFQDVFAYFKSQLQRAKT